MVSRSRSLTLRTLAHDAVVPVGVVLVTSAAALVLDPIAAIAVAVLAALVGTVVPSIWRSPATRAAEQEAARLREEVAGLARRPDFGNRRTRDAISQGDAAMRRYGRPSSRERD